jgi:VIT1/CCC1 family predicted Fe2+/Mn2+ transporter
MLKLHEDYLRSILFGLEDSLVSTSGVVVGMAAATGSNRLVLIAGLIAVSVEALSMGAGQYLSERGVHELDKAHTDNLVVGATLMFACYLTAGLLVITPFLILPFPASAFAGAALPLVALFWLGYFKGRLVRVPPGRSGLEMLFIGGLAALLGMGVGLITKSL